MPWKEVTQVSERLNLCRLADEGKYTVSELARSFGVSRKTVYKWLARYRAQGDAGVFDRSKRPLSSPNEVDQSIVDAIVDLKEKYPQWEPRKLHKLLVDDLGEVCARSTVDRVLFRKGLRQMRQTNPVEEAVGRFERGEANELWQIDFTAPFICSGQKIWPVPILDDHSRFCVGLIAAPGCTGLWALECFRSAALLYGLPLEILSDHGSTFGTSRSYISEFGAYMMAVGVKHIQGRYAHPQTQGKLERFNQSLQKECIRRHNYTSIDDWNKCFDDYRHLYNELRPHQSLCDETPAAHYHASACVFVEPDKNFKEDTDGVIYRKVDASGNIWLFQHKIKVGSGLSGWNVSARHDGNGYWTISFKGREVCQVGIARTAKYQPKK